MWEIGLNVGLRQRWSIPNSFDRGEGKEEEMYVIYITKVKDK